MAACFQSKSIPNICCAEKGETDILEIKLILLDWYLLFSSGKKVQESFNLPENFHPLIKAMKKSVLPLFIANACIYC